MCYLIPCLDDGLGLIEQKVEELSGLLQLLVRELCKVHLYWSCVRTRDEEQDGHAHLILVGVVVVPHDLELPEDSTYPGVPTL